MRTILTLALLLLGLSPALAEGLVLGKTTQFIGEIRCNNKNAAQKLFESYGKDSKEGQRLLSSMPLTDCTRGVFSAIPFASVAQSTKVVAGKLFGVQLFGAMEVGPGGITFFYIILEDIDLGERDL